VYLSLYASSDLNILDDTVIDKALSAYCIDEPWVLLSKEIYNNCINNDGNKEVKIESSSNIRNISPRNSFDSIGKKMKVNTTILNSNTATLSSRPLSNNKQINNQNYIQNNNNNKDNNNKDNNKDNYDNKDNNHHHQNKYKTRGIQLSKSYLEQASGVEINNNINNKNNFNYDDNNDDDGDDDDDNDEDDIDDDIHMNSDLDSDNNADIYNDIDDDDKIKSIKKKKIKKIINNNEIIKVKKNFKTTRLKLFEMTKRRK
jgi:hypothetical protein